MLSLLRLAVALLVLSGGTTWAQNPAVFTDRRINLSGISLNPSAIRLRKNIWAANILSVQASTISNTGQMSPRDLFHVNGNFFRQNVLGTSKISTGYGSFDFVGPTIAYGISSRITFALSTRTRLVANYRDADGRLISEIGEIVKVQHDYPYQVRGNQMHMVTAVFSDINFSISYLLHQSSSHALSFGASLKFINSIGNSSISVPALTGTINRDNPDLTSLTDATGKVSTLTSGKIYADFNFENLLTIRKISLGTSLGFTYEYKPLESEAYKVRLGISVIDIGNLRFQADPRYSKSYDVNIPLGKQLFFNNNFKNSTFSQTTKVFDKHPSFSIINRQKRMNIKSISRPTFMLWLICD